jgi:nitroreductase
MATTRSVRRYTDEKVPPDVLRAILFSATRAPSGSNRQPFRFLVLEDGERERQAKELVAEGARRVWGTKADQEGYGRGSGSDAASPKARMARAMAEYVANLHRVPVMIFPCLVRYRRPTPTEGASVYPACQNLLLAARAVGFGGVMTGFHLPVEDELRHLLAIPDGVLVAATITLGRPAGSHGPVRRRPLTELVFSGVWGEPAAWAADPPGTRFAAAGPPARGADATSPAET